MRFGCQEMGACTARGSKARDCHNRTHTDQDSAAHQKALEWPEAHGTYKRKRVSSQGQQCHGNSNLMLAQMPAEILETVFGHIAADIMKESASHVKSGTYVLFQLCSLTCRKWRDTAISSSVLRRLSMSSFPIFQQSATPLNCEDSCNVTCVPNPECPSGLQDSEDLNAEREEREQSVDADCRLDGNTAEDITDLLLDSRAEDLLRLACRAGNVDAQFLLGLYLSRQKTFAVFCELWPSGSAAGSDELQSNLPKAVSIFAVYDEGYKLLCAAGKSGHPNALYQLGLMSFGGTDAKLRAKLSGTDSRSAETAQSESLAEALWERAAERGHLEARLIVDPNFRLNSLQEIESSLSREEAELRSWRLCSGNKLLLRAKRPQSRSCKARECCATECGMYTLLCEFKQCAGCASSHRKQRYCTRACQKRDWARHRTTCGWVP